MILKEDETCKPVEPMVVSILKDEEKIGEMYLTYILNMNISFSILNQTDEVLLKTISMKYAINYIRKTFNTKKIDTIINMDDIEFKDSLLKMGFKFVLEQDQKELYQLRQ